MSANDTFPKETANVRDPGGEFFAITTSDSSDLPSNTRGLLIGTAGDIKIAGVNQTDAQAVTIPSGCLNTGQWHPMRVRKIFATGTTATNLFGQR